VDQRFEDIKNVLKALNSGDLSSRVKVSGDDEAAQIGHAVNHLAETISQNNKETDILFGIAERINSAKVLEEVVDYAYASLRSVIPYDRIGFSLLEKEGQMLRARYSRADDVEIHLKDGYGAKMEGSSLQEILQTGQPRILNDLDAYLQGHPDSESTKLIRQEGIQSSLTCPLIASGQPIGFIFFSSRQKNTYQNVHVELFQLIAGQLSHIAEKSRLYERLIELNDLKNKFLGIAAHDLRSPLTVVKGNLDLWVDDLLGPITPRQRESAVKMQEYCEAMLALINDLLDVSAIESGVIELNKQRVDLSGFLQKAYGFNSLLAQAKNIEMVLDLPETLPEVDLDPERITQVLNNLLANAIKFSPEKTKVTLSAAVKDSEVEISVRDQGQGIPQEEQKKLFQFFGKTKVKPTAGEKSTGLGLAIVKRMVEAHGGSVGVSSQPGDGATFFFTLPL